MIKTEKLHFMIFSLTLISNFGRLASQNMDVIEERINKLSMDFNLLHKFEKPQGLKKRLNKGRIIF